ELLGAADPGRMRLGVDIEVQLVAGLAPGRAGLVLGPVGHDDRNHMIIRVNFGFHGRFFGAPAPAFSISKGGFGRSITQLGPQNKKNRQDRNRRACSRGGVRALAFRRICQRWPPGLSGGGKLTGQGLMSAVERLEEVNGETPAPAAEASTVEAVLNETPAKSARLRPLLALAPYLARYRWGAILPLISLTVAAITTLVVPVAVRRMIDFGFTPKGIAMINSYFSVMVAVVAVLALARASRYYLVMTIGERIVADLRRDVFAHLMRLSPVFF